MAKHDSNKTTLDGVEQAAADLCCVLDVLNLLTEEQQGNDRFGTLCVIESQLERILESLNNVAFGICHPPAPEEPEQPEQAVGPAKPYFDQIQEQEDRLRDALDSFPPALLGDPDSQLPADTVVRMLQTRDCLSAANAVLRKIVGDGALCTDGSDA